MKTHWRRNMTDHVSNQEVTARVLLTGASSGIGQAIAKKLVERNYLVYGIGRDFGHTDRNLLEHSLFHMAECDLLDQKAMEQMLEGIQEEVGRDGIDILINNAGCAWYGLHEEVSPQKIHDMVRVNLEVPMILTQHFLRTMKEKKHGVILNIASVTGSHFANPHGAAYGATKAGLLSFDRSVFEEARKYGVKVTTILPDMTDTDLYRNADFTADPTAGASLLSEDVAGSVVYIIEERDGVVIPELTIRPQFHRIKRK